MKACFVFAILLVGFVVVSSAPQNRDEESSHLLTKRDTIHVDWPVKCVFYECIANCRQKGYPRGGTCSVLTGCSCLR